MGYNIELTGKAGGYIRGADSYGTDLATRLKQSRLSLEEAVELVATVAEESHHKQGLVHRDYAEVDHLGHRLAVVKAYHHGGRLEIAMDDALFDARAGRRCRLA